MLHGGLQSCEDCHQWLYDKWGKREMKGGQPVKRRPGIKTPCSTCPKGPEPYKKELSRRNLLALEYYRQCLVDDTHLLPRDEIVVRNNSLIRVVEDAIARAQTAAQLAAIRQMKRPDVHG